jgi:hypothetical protein
MADETLRFDIVGEDRLSEPLAKAGTSAGNLSRHMDAAARSAAVLDEALRRQNTASRVSVDATLTLARADKILEDAEHGLTKGALEAEFALKKQAEAAKQSGEAAKKAAAENAAFRKTLSGLSASPGLLGPALLLAPAAGTLAGVAGGAAIGLAGALTAGAGALAAFGAVAKPALSSALTAEQAVNTAQNTYNATIAAGVPKAQALANLQKANASAQLTYNAALAGGANPASALAAYHLALAKNQLAYNSATSTGTFNAKAYAAEQRAIAKAYADLSPQQIALSKQLGAMAQAWQDLKAKQTPVVAGALQPWLKSVTDLTKNLGPIIAAVAPRIRDLGFNFDALINSPQFKIFRDFITNTGSAAVSAAGGTLIDLIDSFIILLPKFNPLIEKAVGWIGGLGPAVLKWSSSQKTASGITAFMDWFNKNGPVVGGLLKNIGAALANLAPGLTAGGAAEIKVISDFLGWVAKLPKGIAAPLTEAAGALLVMSKMGVLKVGLQIVGPAARWLSGGLINIGGGVTAGAEIRAAMVSGGAAAAAEIRAAMAGGAVPGAAAGGAKGAAGGLGAGGLAATAGELLGIISLAALAGTAIGEIFSKITTGKFENFAQWKVKFLSSLDSMRHAAASFGDGVVQDWNLVWANTITRTARGFHDLAGWFDTGRHDIAAHMNQIMSNVIDAWNKLWNNSIGRIQRGFHDTAVLFDTGRHTISVTFDNIRHDIAAKWDLIWSDTGGKVTAGIAKVVTFFQGLPGKVLTALGNAATTLYSWGSGVLTGMLNGIKSIWQSVLNFFTGLPKAILHAIGINSPPGWAVQAGKDIMSGLGIGINAHVQKVVGNAKAAAAAVSGALGGGGGPVSADAAAAQRYAQSRLSAYGWAANQMIPLMALWNQESGWNRFAYNASSGATGIPQALPFSKMPKAAWLPSQGGQASAGAQIDWGLGYIKGRYGSPAAAEAHEQAFNWYGSGLDAIFRRPTVIGVGERGPEHVTVTPGGGQDKLAAKLDQLIAEIRQLTAHVDAVPRATGQHVGGAINGAAAAASFGRRYP